VNILQFVKLLFAGLSLVDRVRSHNNPFGFVVDTVRQGKCFIFRGTSTGHCQSYSI